jgi:hypothetical protein
MTMGARQIPGSGPTRRRLHSGRFKSPVHTARPMFSAIAMWVTERPALKSFTASSALSRADGRRPI